MGKVVVFIFIIIIGLFGNDTNLKSLKTELAKAKIEEKKLQQKIHELETKITPHTVYWKFHGELGYIATDGNTNTQSFNTDLKIKRKFYKHLFTYTFDAQYAKDEDTATNNKYRTEFDYNYKLDDIWKTTYLIGYIRDKFSAFRYQFYTGPGMEYQVLKSQLQKVLLQGNILYSIDDRYEENIKNDYVSARVNGKYFLKISQNMVFSEEISYRTDLETTQNYFIYSVTKLGVKVYKYFSMNISYKADYTNDANEKENLDTTFSVNGVIDF